MALPLFCSEIDQAPSKVLATRHPHVPNYGDMTALAGRILAEGGPAPDFLVGGTPCQGFSVAGLRKSMADARGNLAFEYIRLADAIDAVRNGGGEEPCVALWENVPGVLSTKDNAFGCFLAGLVGADEPVLPGGKRERWTRAGMVRGPKRSAAWRVLNAEFFGLAQRRERVFVVASARAGFCPGQVLFEPEGVRRHTAPSRKTGQDIAGTLAARSGAGGGLGTDMDLDGGLVVTTAYCRNNTSGALDTSSALTAHPTSRYDFEADTFVVQCATGDISHALKAEGADGSEDGTGRGTPIVASFHSNLGSHGGGVLQDLSVQLKIGGNGGHNPPAVAMTFQSSQSGIRLQKTHATLDANNGSRRHNGVLSVALRGRDGGNMVELGDDVAFGLRSAQGGSDKAHVLDGVIIRRLTPTECERLQGYPDEYTAAGLADSPRYKCLGNSWAVPVVRWIARRIVAHADGLL